eukprot:TRINITY_DN6949_c0_g1_i3.p1 TRINITY_DN6949_c0_g1~~TRINITY_DN6949_c0_g1_i3.p1  ORF type:complete len:389 (-),score=58.64 TRINITY_DN6949_c0_g1_i3:51-1217(-)
MMDKKTKLVVMRLLHLEHIQYNPRLSKFVSIDDFGTLLSIGLLESVQLDQNEYLISLDSNFRTSILDHLYDVSQIDNVELGIDSGLLEEYYQEKWENIILYLMGEDIRIPSNVKDILVFAKIYDENGLTKEGVKYLLLNDTQKLWLLMKSYVELKFTTINPIEIMRILMEICYIPIGQKRCINNESEAYHKLYYQLSELGLIYIENDYFTSTPLALKLSYRKGVDDVSHTGFIVVESNYQVYAYTSSDAHFRILNMITTVELRLPNMIICKLTRQSIKNAIQVGLSCNEVIRYLESNLHTTMNSLSEIYEQVFDQLRLWEKERNRITYESGILYELQSEHIFNLIIECASDLNAILWCNYDKMMLFVKEEAHPKIRTFVRDMRNKNKS